MSENRKMEDQTNVVNPNQDISALIRSQKDHFATGATLPLAARKDALYRLEENLKRREDAILDALEADLGKPRTEAWLAEVMFVKQEIRHTLRKLGNWAKPRRASHPFFLLPASSHIRPEPLGTVLVIAPWNYPLQLALSPTIAAIAAGNCVTIKPAEATPATSRLLAELIESSFPASHVAVVQGDAATGAELLEQDFDHFFFTGGERVGRIVAEAAARKLAPCTLELGGKSPAIIDWSTNMDLAVERIAIGKFFNAGQTCIAPDFVAVPDMLLGEFREKLNAFLRNAYDHPEMEIACCISADHRDRVLSLTPDDAQSFGKDDGLRLAPRWSVVDWDHPSMQEEIFGPFLPVIAYTDREECLQRIADMPSPLALYLFSDSKSFSNEAMVRIRTGSVCINDVVKQATNPNLPFGGIGPSGYGRYRGKAGFDTFSNQRAVTRRYMLNDPFSAKPPYGDLLEKMRKWI